MNNYDSKSIKVKTFVDDSYGFEKVEVLALKYNKDSDFISRGLEACERAGVSHQYFVQRYLENDKTIPLNDEVNMHAFQIQKETSHGQHSKPT